MFFAPADPEETQSYIKKLAGKRIYLLRIRQDDLLPKLNLY